MTWGKDIKKFYNEIGMKIEKKDKESIKKFYEFRKELLREEYLEFLEASSSEDTIDALIDLCVIAIVTLELFGVDTEKAWKEVLKANKAKIVGKKESRPNPFGLPDLAKPIGWKPPFHGNNKGILEEVL